MIFSKRQAHTIAQCISSRLLVLRLWEDNHIIYIDKHCLPKVPRQKGLHSMLEEARVICSVTLYVNKFASGSALKYTLHRGNSNCSASHPDDCIEIWTLIHVSNSLKQLSIHTTLFKGDIFACLFIMIWRDRTKSWLVKSVSWTQSTWASQALWSRGCCWSLESSFPGARLQDMVGEGWDSKIEGGKVVTPRV